MNVSLPRDASFATTHWTVVLGAKDKSSPQALTALGELCRTYWYPLYAYARGRGHSVEDAQDLTQEFFARVLEKNYLRAADRSKGRFRWFLLAAFKRFLANEFDRGQAQKRGAGEAPLSLDLVGAEEQLGLEPRRNESPDRIFDRRWALALLEQVQQRLREEYVAAGKGDRYHELVDYLPGDTSAKSYAQAGAALGLSEGAVKVEVHRMKRRFGRLLREEIAQTVAGGAEELEEEIRYLLSVTGSS